jgi:hypothetical protein
VLGNAKRKTQNAKRNTQYAIRNTQYAGKAMAATSHVYNSRSSSMEHTYTARYYAEVSAYDTLYR